MKGVYQIHLVHRLNSQQKLTIDSLDNKTVRKLKVIK
jgi:hypothetical protein